MSIKSDEWFITICDGKDCDEHHSYLSTNNSMQNKKKVSFGNVEYIKVQSYKMVNRNQRNNNNVILTNQEIDCTCNCVLV